MVWINTFLLQAMKDNEISTLEMLFSNHTVYYAQKRWGKKRTEKSVGQQKVILESKVY